MKSRIITVDIEKLNIDGYGQGEFEERKILAWNALPGERVQVDILKRKAGIWYGPAIAIEKSSNLRQSPVEDHFLSCSPWQTMTFAAENDYKKSLAQEIFAKELNWSCPDLEIYSDRREYGYRNKMEFSFYGDDSGLHLSFFKRMQRGKVAIEGCALADPAINTAAQAILKILNKHKIERGQLKSLILRSNNIGQVLAILFVKDESLELIGLDTLDLAGLEIYFSEPKSPASLPTKLIHSQGSSYLKENILTKSLTFGGLNFFQVNTSVFSQTLADIKEFVQDQDVVDFYSGVGTISISLSDVIKSAVLVDIDETGIAQAKLNVAANGLENTYTATASPSEKMLEHIKVDKVLIVDPPRFGMHEDVVSAIALAKPKCIVYLSCNIQTQVRDLALLKDSYKPVFTKIYNYFPRTPHIESLVVLKRN